MGHLRNLGWRAKNLPGSRVRLRERSLTVQRRGRANARIGGGELVAGVPAAVEAAVPGTSRLARAGASPRARRRAPDRGSRNVLRRQPGPGSRARSRCAMSAPVTVCQRLQMLPWTRHRSTAAAEAGLLAGKSGRELLGSPAKMAWASVSASWLMRVCAAENVPRPASANEATSGIASGEPHQRALELTRSEVAVAAVVVASRRPPDRGSRSRASTPRSRGAQSSGRLSAVRVGDLVGSSAARARAERREGARDRTDARRRAAKIGGAPPGAGAGLRRLGMLERPGGRDPVTSVRRQGGSPRASVAVRFRLSRVPPRAATRSPSCR